MAAHQAPLSTGFSRQEYWSGLQFPFPIYILNFVCVYIYTYTYICVCERACEYMWVRILEQCGFQLCSSNYMKIFFNSKSYSITGSMASLTCSFKGPIKTFKQIFFYMEELVPLTPTPALHCSKINCICIMLGQLPLLWYIHLTSIYKITTGINASRQILPNILIEFNPLLKI